MKIAREGKLQQVLDEMGVKNPRSHEIPFSLLVEHLNNAMHQQTHVDIEHRIAIGIVRAIAATKGTAKKKRLNWIKILAWFGVIVTLLAIVATNAHAQAPSVNITRIGGTIISGTNPIDVGNTAFRVNCVTGCSAAATFADSSAFTFATSSINNISAVVDDVATNTVAENSAGAVRMNTNRILYVDLSKSAANTNKFLVTPDPITFASPQHVIADAGSAVIGHVIVDTTSTTAVTQATGTNLHVVLDTTSTTAVTQATSSNLNADANVKTINAVVPMMGNGITGTGSQRVTIASDNTAFSVNAAATLAAETTKVIGTARIIGNAGAIVDAANAAAVPANVVMAGVYEAANSGRIIQCDKTAKADIATATTTSLVAVSGSTSVYVCSFTIEIQGVVTTAGTLILETGTGAACTSPAVVTPTFVGSTIAGQPWSVTQGSSLGYVFKGAASSGLCALSTTTTPQRVFISYAQF